MSISNNAPVAIPAELEQLSIRGLRSLYRQLRDAGYGQIPGYGSLSKSKLVVAIRNLIAANPDSVDPQQAIIDAIKAGSHVVVEAVPGAGKSTVLTQAARQVTGRTLAVAFAKRDVDSLQASLSGTTVEVCTAHSLGFATVHEAMSIRKVDKSKYVRLCDKEATDELEALMLPKLVHLVQTSLVDTYDSDAFKQAAFKNHIYLGPITLEHLRLATQRVLNAGLQQAMELGVISFSDMLWLPHELDLPVQQYKRILLDEGQDISRAAFALLCKALNPSGQFVAVGDSNQSIYGFIGAMRDALDVIASHFDSQRLHLSISYRCPSRIVRFIKQAVELDTEEFNAARDGGSVRRLPQKAFPDRVSPGDAILVDRNIQGLDMALKLLQAGKQPELKGYDLHDTVRSLVGHLQQHCQRQGKEWLSDSVLDGLSEEFIQVGKRKVLNLYQYAELEIQRRSNVHAGTRGYYQRVELLERILLHLLRKAVSGSKTHLEAMSKATPDKSSLVTVSSVWRAKGGQWQNVYCSSMGTVSQRVWFIAISRASQQLFIAS